MATWGHTLCAGADAPRALAESLAELTILHLPSLGSVRASRLRLATRIRKGAYLISATTGSCDASLRGGDLKLRLPMVSGPKPEVYPLQRIVNLEGCRVGDVVRWVEGEWRSPHL